MRKKTLIILILSILTMIPSVAEAKQFTLVIDAGHGGHDAGAVGSFSKEKNINLSVALAFGRYVERNCPDVKVIYTRKTDVFVTLHGRADIANKAKADLFMSIHTNSLPAGHISRGMETYTLGMHRAADNLEVAKRENEVILQEKDYRERYQGFDPNSSESYIIFEFMQDNNMQRSVDLAKLVQKHTCSIANRPNKGVKQAGFLVLRETSMPSCLIELGFISTPDEERMLNNETSVENMARGIYNAFVAYKKTYSGTDAIYRTEEPLAYAAPAETATPAEVPAKEVTAKSNSRQSKTEKAEQKVADATTQQPDGDAPVYKVQILASDKVLKSNSPLLKGQTEAEYYKEGSMVKYTIGKYATFNEANQKRRELNSTFPGCFVVKMINGQRVK